MRPRRTTRRPSPDFGAFQARAPGRFRRGRVVWQDGVPFVLIVAGVLVHAAPLGHLTGTPLLAAACFAAAYRMSVPATLLVGALVVTAGPLSAPDETDWLHPNGAIDLTELIVLAVVSVIVCRVRRRRDDDLATAQAVAESVRQAVLPSLPGRSGPLEISGRYEAAYSAARIGGDLYAVMRTGHGVRLMIGDVRGKGLGAMAAVAALLGAFRESAPRTRDLPSLVACVEESERQWREQFAQVPTSGADERFTTMLFAEVSDDGRVLRTANCGHPAPLLLRRGRAPLPLDPPVPGLPIGLRELEPDRAAVREDELSAGDVLVLFTDGVNEARDRDGRFFDPLAHFAARPMPDGPGPAADGLAEAARRHSGGVLADDMAILTASPR